MAENPSYSATFVGSEAAIGFDGRTVQIVVLINTDEPIQALVRRVQEAAKGPLNRMVLVAGSEADTVGAGLTWEVVLRDEEDARKAGMT